MPAASKAYYPLFADLTRRRCVVVGGGLVAERKVTALLRFGAAVVVVSPTLTKRLSAYVRQGAVTHIPRRFRPADLRGAWLVYAATDDQQINELVFRTATQRRMLTNVVDQKPLCSFIAPAIVKRGDLVIAISTGGASPAIAKHLRRELTHVVGLPYSRMLKLLRGLRATAKRQLPSSRARKRYFDRLVQGRVFELIRAGKARAARREALALLDRSTNGA